MLTKRILFSVSFFFMFISLFAQEHHEDEFKPHHSLSLLIGHTQVIEGLKENGKKKWLSLASWDLNYNYTFHPKWAIGLHNDIVLEEFEVEKHSGGENEVVLDRSFPVASALMVSYKPGKHFSYMLGPGGEFAKSGNLFLIRIGVEYEYHLQNNWALNGLLTNDYKVNAYNSWTIALGITKIF